ncbi:hypothetical protein HID58_063624 [Brassica napus]|uniref:Glycylpeptide N-tetradecanoyltransferase n=1 Tax=Brassica napus TaxID=3708 RepID=A0ABQ8A5N4_BRANA|nr:hypothetical protein HID58_063624 [Brassica napus]
MKITDTIERNHFTNDPAEWDNFISELLLERFDEREQADAQLVPIEDETEEELQWRGGRQPTLLVAPDFTHMRRKQMLQGLRLQKRAWSPTELGLGFLKASNRARRSETSSADSPQRLWSPTELGFSFRFSKAREEDARSSETSSADSPVLANQDEAVHTFWQSQPIEHLSDGPIQTSSLVKKKPEKIGEAMSIKDATKLYELPNAPVTPGFRKMVQSDVHAVTELLRVYLLEFEVAAEFREEDVKNWLLPKNNVVDCYVVEDPETHVVTDCCSFYTISFTVGGRKNVQMKGAYSYYNVATKTPLVQLIRDILIICRQNKFDIFHAKDVMDNKTFFEQLKFEEVGAQNHFYLFNQRLRTGLQPSQLGLTLF